MTYILTEEEAVELIRLLKDALDKRFLMPSGGERGKGFNVISQSTEDEFRISLYRGKIDYGKHSINVSAVEGGSTLMRLCVGGHPHTNPDGSVIAGTHLHVYHEGFDDRIAVPMTITSPNFIDDTLMILTRFHVVEHPQLIDGMIP